MDSTSCCDTRRQKERLGPVQVETAALHVCRSYCSVNFFHSWTASSASWCTARHIWHTVGTTATASCLIHFHHDWIDDSLELFLLGLELVFLSELVLVQPVQCFLNSFFNLFFVVTLK